MKSLIAAAAAALALAGCASTDLSDINTAGRAPSCTRECTGNYSQCASGTAVGLTPNMALKACKSSLRMCVESCPAGS
jgi:hypothetical protein